MHHEEGDAYPMTHVLHSYSWQSEQKITVFANRLSRGFSWRNRYSQPCPPEIQTETLPQGEHRRLLLWEEAEGGTGIWERLAREPHALAEVARQALALCHFDPDTGDDANEHDSTKCAVACYECLLTYSNQLHHRHIDRRLLPEFLRLLASATTIPVEERNQDEQYQWLEGLIDPNSSLEREFLRFLRDSRIRLPDNAQNRPAPGVHVQPDFYYNRENLPGGCVFVDGPYHDGLGQQHTDSQVRTQLRDYGFRVIAIRHDRPFMEQVQEHPDVFVAYT